MHFCDCRSKHRSVENLGGAQPRRMDHQRSTKVQILGMEISFPALPGPHAGWQNLLASKVSPEDRWRLVRWLRYVFTFINARPRRG